MSQRRQVSRDLFLSLAIVEHIRRVMWLCKGNVSEAARRLGVTRRTLQRWNAGKVPTANSWRG